MSEAYDLVAYPLDYSLKMLARSLLVAVEVGALPQEGSVVPPMSGVGVTDSLVFPYCTLMVVGVNRAAGNTPGFIFSLVLCS